MVTDSEILSILEPLIHPETGKNIVEMEMVEDIVISEERVKFTLSLKRPKDPFATKLKSFSVALIEEAFPEYKDNVTVIIKEPAPRAPKAKGTEFAETNSAHFGKIIAVSSCKGGVGKSTTTINLAVTLSQMGYRVGVLDADVYGPSMPKMLALEDYQPMGVEVDGKDMILPAEKFGLKVMSIGFFIKPKDALLWRGAMATNAIKQLIHQTRWDELDFLVIDMPPGTGDIHLSILTELKVDGAIIVTTPQKVALLDVVRGIEMFNASSANINILGLIENMSWFTPEELPNNKYYIFGKENTQMVADEYNIPLLGQIPLIEGVSSGGDSGKPRVLESEILHKQFEEVAKVVLTLLN